jgi:hypothetical protein
MLEFGGIYSCNMHVFFLFVWKVYWNLVGFVHILSTWSFLFVWLQDLFTLFARSLFFAWLPRFVDVLSTRSLFFAWLKGFIYVVCEVFSFHVDTKVYSCSLEGLFSSCQVFILVWLHGLCVVQEKMVIL